MKPISYFVTSIPLLLVSWFVVLTVSAQNKPAASAETVSNAELQKLYFELPIAKLPTPRAADGHPELSGFWNNPFAGVTLSGADGQYGFLLGPRGTPASPARNIRNLPNRLTSLNLLLRLRKLSTVK